MMDSRRASYTPLHSGKQLRQEPHPESALSWLDVRSNNDSGLRMDWLPKPAKPRERLPQVLPLNYNGRGPDHQECREKYLASRSIDDVAADNVYVKGLNRLTYGITSHALALASVCIDTIDEEWPASQHIQEIRQKSIAKRKHVYSTWGKRFALLWLKAGYDRASTPENMYKPALLVIIEKHRPMKRNLVHLIQGVSVERLGSLETSRNIELVRKMHCMGDMLILDGCDALIERTTF